MIKAYLKNLMQAWVITGSLGFIAYMLILYPMWVGTLLAFSCIYAAVSAGLTKR